MSIIFSFLSYILCKITGSSAQRNALIRERSGNHRLQKRVQDPPEALARRDAESDQIPARDGKLTQRKACILGQKRVQKRFGLRGLRTKRSLVLGALAHAVSLPQNQQPVRLLRPHRRSPLWANALKDCTLTESGGLTSRAGAELRSLLPLFPRLEDAQLLRRLPPLLRAGCQESELLALLACYGEAWPGWSQGRRRAHKAPLCLLLSALLRQDYDPCAVLEIVRRTLY